MALYRAFKKRAHKLIDVVRRFREFFKKKIYLLDGLENASRYHSHVEEMTFNPQELRGF